MRHRIAVFLRRVARAEMKKGNLFLADRLERLADRIDR